VVKEVSSFGAWELNLGRPAHVEPLPGQLHLRMRVFKLTILFINDDDISEVSM
jgi:hypothetical protein